MNDRLQSTFSLVLRCAAAALALCVAPYYSIRTWAAVVDPDIWWHIRTGDWIGAHHALPHFAIFSQHSERPWVAYSWAFDMLVSGVLRTFHLVGIPDFLICLQIVLSLTFLIALQRVGRGFWLPWLIGLLGIYAFYVNPLRSMQFTLLLFIIELWLIFEADHRHNDKLLFWTGPLFVLWANLHIQFIYGLFVLALYVTSRIIAMVWGQAHDQQLERSRTRPLLAFLAALAATCIGPNWINPYKVIFDLVFHTGEYQLVQEMMAMNFRRPEHYVELGLLMVACYAVGRSQRRDFFRPALLLVTAMVSFRSLRDAWFVSIAASFLLAEAIGQWHSLAAKQPEKEIRARYALTFGMASVLALCISFGFATQQGANARGLINVIARVYPVGATSYIRNAHLTGPMYNSFNWGGFLIFNLRDEPVSIDSRGNAYDDELMRRSVNTVNGVGWQNDPDLTRANFALLERSAPLASALARDPHFRLVYQDDISAVFVRNQ